MTTKKGTKRALLLSLLSLITCVTMLVGSTFAWFTDSVTSAGNIIKSGTLKVTMEWKEATDETATSYADASQGPIFNYDLWEPGYVEAKNVKISNVGSLALQYSLNIEAEDEVSELADVIDVYFADGEYVLNERADLSNLRLVGTLSDVLAGMPANMTGALEAEDSATVTIALKMQEGAGNDYQNLSIGSKFSVILMATQDNVEKDSFDENYDDITLVADDTALRAAIAAGGNILLTDDIAFDADETITVADDADVVLDLNGYKISSTSSTSGKNRALFTVKGNMSVIGNGTVSMVYTGSNMGWSNLTAPFSVEAGELTLGNGVNVVNLGGTDMAYAVDVNTTLGETVLNVEGANLYSSYIGVRIFNNHSTAKGIVNYNSGVIQGAKNGYDIWAQLMSKPAENAVVNIADGITYTTADLSGTMYYIESTTSFVSTNDELVTALTEGGKIVLASDLALAPNTTIVVASGKESTLDLNGNTLSSENTNTATHNFMIDVKGGTLNISNGTVAIKHTGTNMGWNGATTAIDVTAGGVLNLKNTTVKNEGGTDMNFAVHLNNWGDVTVNADNCVFDAPYCGFRVFNSGPAMNNVKITNSKITGGTRAFWVHNYASADMGGKTYSGSSVAYDQSVVDARLNLDIYNNNNTFEITGTAKSPIRYGFNSAVYYDASGNIVP